MSYNQAVTNRAGIPLTSQTWPFRRPQYTSVSRMMMTNSQHLGAMNQYSNSQGTMINKTCPGGFPVGNPNVNQKPRVTQDSICCTQEQIPGPRDSFGDQYHQGLTKAYDSLDHKTDSSNISQNDTHRKMNSFETTRTGTVLNRGKKVKSIRPGCLLFCKKRCKKKISQATREDIFKEYRSKDGFIEKRKFIANNTKKLPLKKSTINSRRHYSVDWAFTINGESLSVCKLFFLDTLGISEATAYVAVRYKELFPNKKSLITDRREVKRDRKQKPSWYETDLDDYTPYLNSNSKTRVANNFSNRVKYDMKPGCVVCRKKCQRKFSKEDRQQIFNVYRGLSTFCKQMKYIVKLVIKRKTQRLNSRRGWCFEWYLNLRGKRIPVCKTFFLHTVGISERTVHNMCIRRKIKPAVSNKYQSNAIKTAITRHKSAASITAKRKLKSALKHLNPCRKHCQSKFTYKERLSIYKAYQEFDMRHKQDFISRCVVKTQCQESSQSLRTSSVSWYLPLNEDFIKVCQAFFLQTLDVSEKTVYSLWTKKCEKCTSSVESWQE